jgi:hypothetical protein
VTWEAGIIVELPPGIFFYYLSSIFFHCNIYHKGKLLLYGSLNHTLINLITDFDIVTTIDRSLPTQENSTPLPVNEKAWSREETQESIVWFNQASMFQTSELNISTIAEAKKVGIDTDLDIQEMMMKKCSFRVW